MLYNDNGVNQHQSQNYNEQLVFTKQKLCSVKKTLLWNLFYLLKIKPTAQIYGTWKKATCVYVLVVIKF